MNTEIPLAAAIAILLPVFYHKLANEVTGYNKVHGMCNEQLGRQPQISIGGISNNSNDQCWKEREHRMKKIEFKKHWMLLIVGVASIFASLQMFPSGASQMGTGWGGLLTILSAVAFHWHHYNETQKLYVTGGCLATVIFYALNRTNGWN